MRTFLFATLASAVATFALATEPQAQPKKNDLIAKAVKKYEAIFEPAEAKPGQTVTFKLTVHLNDGYQTYPSKQVDKMAEGMVNKFVFPDPGAVVFVGGVTDSTDFKKKSEPDVGIKELRYYEGKVVYERKAVVNPSQKPGDAVVKLTAFKIVICDANNCYPAKTLSTDVTLKVIAGSVPVASEYADEVKKALDAK